jgi:hypothetical protein
MVVPSTKVFFRSKNKAFGPVQMQKITFFEFFSSISRGLGTGTIGENLIFILQIV